MATLNNIVQAKRMFLSYFAEHGRIHAAAAHAGRTADCVHKWLKRDEKFKSEFEDCKNKVIEKLEAEADRRAVDGVGKPVFYKGKIVGETKEYSDTLLLARLKALDPARYRENISAEVTGKAGKPLFMELLEKLRGLDDDGEQKS